MLVTWNIPLNTNKLESNDHFSGEPGLAGCPRDNKGCWSKFFYRQDVLCLTQRTVSTHWRHSPHNSKIIIIMPCSWQNIHCSIDIKLNTMHYYTLDRVQMKNRPNHSILKTNIAMTATEELLHDCPIIMSFEKCKACTIHEIRATLVINPVHRINSTWQQTQHTNTRRCKFMHKL